MTGRADSKYKRATTTLMELELTSGVRRFSLRGSPSQVLPSVWEPGVPWGLSRPPIVTSSVDGPHTFQWYNSRSLDLSDKDSLLARLSFEYGHSFRSPDTSVVLEFHFTPSPGRPLGLNALKIPPTRSVRSAADQERPPPLALRILLVDAVADMFDPVRKWDQEKEDEQTLAPCLVDFQAKDHIIDLRDAKAIVRFKLPCCFLDSTHRTGYYR